MKFYSSYFAHIKATNNKQSKPNRILPFLIEQVVFKGGFTFQGAMTGIFGILESTATH
jgi:hypothetical protein